MSVVIENNIFESKYYVENVVTLPEYRGKGFVKLLLDKVKTEIPGVNLELYCNNEMVGFYEKMGFTNNGVVASKYL
jgi:ribosomal protein S18 acetylase RimI-like enzyme